jgi:creatinine amidohydrolase
MFGTGDYEGQKAGKKKIFWQEMWRHELEDAAKKSAVIIVPTGSVEQHGPHSPMDVDVVGPLQIAIRTALAINDFDVIVTPPIWSGFAHYNMGFAGTISLRMETYRNLLLDVCRSVFANGFPRIVVLNGHGGNHAPNVTVKHELSQENVFILTLSWWELVHEEMAKLSSADGSDVGHGGEWETSVQLYLRPDLVARDRMVSDRDLTNPFSPMVQEFMGGWGAFAERRRDTENHTGTMGDPLAATPEKGRKIVEAASRKLGVLVREYRALPLREYSEFGSYCP